MRHTVSGQEELVNLIRKNTDVKYRGIVTGSFVRWMLQIRIEKSPLTDTEFAVRVGQSAYLIRNGVVSSVMNPLYWSDRNFTTYRSSVNTHYENSDFNLKLICSIVPQLKRIKDFSVAYVHKKHLLKQKASARH